MYIQGNHWLPVFFDLGSVLDLDIILFPRPCWKRLKIDSRVSRSFWTRAVGLATRNISSYYRGRCALLVQLLRNYQLDLPKTAHPVSQHPSRIASSGTGMWLLSSKSQHARFVVWIDPGAFFISDYHIAIHPTLSRDCFRKKQEPKVPVYMQ